MATIRDYYETDFKRDVVVNNTFDFDFDLGLDGRLVSVPARLHLDFDSNAKFLCLFLPRVPDPGRFIGGLFSHLERVLSRLNEGPSIKVGTHGELQADARDLTFAGRVFAYAEDDLPIEQIRELGTALRRQGMFLRFRGPEYARTRSAWERPLAFISYDSSDRAAVAQPLAHELAQLRCWAWFDQYSMRAGDPIAGTIQKGLDACQRCIVVLSAQYLTNQRWARREFEAVTRRERREGRALVIPLRCGVTEAQVADFSPSLADRRCIEWEASRAAAIASELAITLLSVGREHER